MDLFSFILLVFLSFHGAKSTFSPSGSVSIDCEGQRIFTCTVAANGPATWIITGLQGITAAGSNGVIAGNLNARITSAEITPGATSAITITGFTTADTTGTVQCTDQVGVVEGSATVVVVSTVASVTNVMANVNQSAVTLTWSEPSDSSATTSVSCTPPSPQCSSCTSSGCTIGGLTPSTPYTFSVTRSRTGCDDSTATISTVNREVVVPPGCPLCWLLLLLLLLLIPVVYSICVALVWHFRYKDYHYCQVYWCCCFCITREGDGNKRTSSTEPMKASSPPSLAPVAAAAPLGEYADPKDVRKRKEENKIQYADLEFTKQSGGGQGTIHQKEEPVTYTAIQHA